MFRASLFLLAALAGFALTSTACREHCTAIDGRLLGDPTVREACEDALQEQVCCPGGSVFVGKDAAIPFPDRASACLSVSGDGMSDVQFTDCELADCAEQDPCHPTSAACEALNRRLSAAVIGTEACPCNDKPEACPSGTFCHVSFGTCQEPVPCIDGGALAYCEDKNLRCVDGLCVL